MLGTRFSRQVSSDFIDWVTKDTVSGLMYYWAEPDVFYYTPHLTRVQDKDDFFMWTQLMNEGLMRLF